MLSSQVTRYLIVGGLGTATHLAILTFCVEWLGLDAVLCTSAGFLGALLVSYALNHCWTFQSRRPHVSSFWRYVTVSLSGLLLNTGMMYTLVSLFHWWYLTAQLSVILIVPISNFLMNRYWTFSSNPELRYAEKNKDDRPSETVLPRTMSMDKIPSGFRQDAWLASALVLLAGLIFHALPAGYWRGDDSAILLHALNSKGLSAFYDPNDWQKLSPSNLTPWVTLSFKIDLWLAGLSPGFFYVHQLCSLGMVVATAYALSRQWLSPVWAFLSVGLFLVGAPTASVTELLMTRHYLEGMLFALLAVLAFVHALRQQRMLWAFAGALAYALAVTAKEIYVPLVLVVLLIPPINNLGTRLRLASPFIGVAVLYIFWRRYMLGAMVGGYADTNSMLSYRSVTGMIKAMAHFPEFFFGSPWKLPTILFGGALALTLFKRASMIPVSVVLAAGIVGPLVPLIAFPGISGPDRYLYLFWFVASFACVLSIRIAVSLISSNKSVQYSIGIPLCLLMMTLTVFHTRDMDVSRQAGYREFDVQGRFIFEAGKQQGFVPTQPLLNSYWYVTSLCEIKKQMGAWCPESLIKGLPVNRNIERFFAYDPGQEMMVDITDKIGEEIARIESIDLSRPLFGKVSMENGRVRWHFGPYENGQYYVASPKIGRYPLTKTGELRTLETDIAFHIQYESPDGWVTSSPLLTAQKGQPVIWERTPAK